MSDWMRAPLGSLVTITGGGTPDRGVAAYYGGSIPWVTPKDMKSWNITTSQEAITEKGLAQSAARLIEPNSVLLVVRSGVLKHTLPVGVNRVRIAINQDMKALRPGPDLDADFLARFLKASSNRILRWVRATTADNFPIDRLKKFEIPVPPLLEQRRIAAILDAAQALREKRRQSIAKLDSLLQSVFFEMFGDPIHSGTYLERLSECAEVVSGVTKGRRLNGRKTVELPYLRVANVQAGYLDLKEIKTITALPSDLESLILQDGDILLTEGGDHDKLGRGARWRGELENCIHQNHVFRVRVNRNRILPEFLEAYLQTSFSRDYFLRCAKKTTNLASINMTQLRALPVMLPPMHLQFKSRSAFLRIESLKERQISWLAKHQSLFTSLQHRAFRGEL
jgi:type I restriction enzyme, S subunit